MHTQLNCAKYFTSKEYGVSNVNEIKYVFYS